MRQRTSVPKLLLGGNGGVGLYGAQIMTFTEAQIQAIKDNDLAGATLKIAKHLPAYPGQEMAQFGTARLIAYLLKRVTQAEELIGAIVEANERAA